MTNTPSFRAMLANPAHLISMGFGSGLSPKAPGTAGTLWAWATFAAIDYTWAPSVWAWLIACFLGTLIGWWASTATARATGVEDPGFVVIDEIIAMWAILALVMPCSWGWQLFAFALFRFFDAVKMGPVAWADKHFKGFGWRGGWGIMFDDLIAAVLALAVYIPVQLAWTAYN